MTNAEFFARNAVARGQKPNVVDINPATGRIRTAFDGLNDERAQRNARVSRSANGGMTVARPGFPSQPKILGVDAQQAAEQDYARDHKDDSFWLQAMQARQNDPRAGHMTPEQYAAAVAAHDPTGRLAPAMGIKTQPGQSFAGGQKIDANGQLVGGAPKPVDPAFQGGQRIDPNGQLVGGMPPKAPAPPPAAQPQPGIPLAGTPPNADSVRVAPPRGSRQTAMTPLKKPTSYEGEDAGESGDEEEGDGDSDDE